MKNTATLRLMMLKRLIQYFELQPAVSSAKCGNHLGSALLLVTKLATQIGKLYLTYPCRTYTFRPTFGCFFGHFLHFRGGRNSGENASS